MPCYANLVLERMIHELAKCLQANPALNLCEETGRLQLLNAACHVSIHNDDDNERIISLLSTSFVVLVLRYLDSSLPEA